MRAGKETQRLGRPRSRAPLQSTGGNEISLSSVSLFQDSGEAIISKKLDGTIVSWNSGAEQLFGWRRQEMVGESILRLVPAARIHEERDILQHLRLGERIDGYETVRQTPTIA